MNNLHWKTLYTAACKTLLGQWFASVVHFYGRDHLDNRINSLGLVMWLHITDQSIFVYQSIGLTVKRCSVLSDIRHTLEYILYWTICVYIYIYIHLYCMYRICVHIYIYIYMYRMCTNINNLIYIYIYIYLERSTVTRYMVEQDRLYIYNYVYI